MLKINQLKWKRRLESTTSRMKEAKLDPNQEVTMEVNKVKAKEVVKEVKIKMMK